MTTIAGTYGNQCVARALSTMSAALGLGGKLPNDFPGSIKDFEIPDLLPQVFLGHRIQVWHSDHGFFAGLRSDLWEYCGSDYMPTPDVDNWLVGFCYENEAGTEGHCVIGVPQIFGDKPAISLIFSVEIKE